MCKDEIGNLWIKWIICVEAAIINNMFSLAIYNQYPPECESIHILLNHHPCIHFHRPVSSQLHRQILGINVVKKLSRMCKVKDVKVVQILIYQLAKWRLTCKIEVKFVKLGCSGYKSRVKICPYLGLTQPTSPQIWKKTSSFLGFLAHLEQIFFEVF